MGREFLIKNSRYNQNISPGSILIEVGSDANSLEEAKEAAKAARKSGEFARISKPHIDSEGKLVVVGARIREGVRRAGSLKYYRAETIPMDDSALYDISDNLLQHIRELVELENDDEAFLELESALKKLEKSLKKSCNLLLLLVKLLKLLHHQKGNILHG